jgi:hypothetical protein
MQLGALLQPFLRQSFWQAVDNYIKKTANH